MIFVLHHKTNSVVLFNLKMKWIELNGKEYSYQLGKEII